MAGVQENMSEKLSIDQRHRNPCANREQKNHDSFAEVQPEVTTARSRNMAAIRSKDTKPEIIVRKYLWSHGFRYRLNHPRLPGKPDIVLRKYRTCIFVNGCFWHKHEGCKYFVVPKTRTKFWQNKMNRNQERDIEVKKKLATMGWHTITIWECELKPVVREQTLASLDFTLNHIFLEDHKVKRYEMPEEAYYTIVAEDILNE